MLLRYVRPHWPLAALLTLLLVVTTATQLAGPDLLGTFVDGVTTDASTTALLVLGLVFVGSILAKGGLGILNEAVGGRLAWRSTNALRADLLRHCLDADHEFHSNHSPGELISRVDGDTGKLAAFASQLLILLAVNVLLLVGICVMLWRVDWRIGLGCAVLVAVGVARVRRLVGAAVPATAEASRVGAEISGYVEERVRGAEDIVPNGATAHALHGLVVLGGEKYRTTTRSVRLNIRWVRMAQHLNWIGMVCGLAGSTLLYQAGSVSLGDVYAVLAYLTLMRIPILVISGHMSQIDEAMAAMRRTRELLAETPSIRSGTTELPAGPLSVELSDVDFSYPDRTVLHGVDLSVPAGRHLALVGVTGGGKTTIARLLTRILDPDTGVVKVGGVDLRDAESTSLRSSITYVTQEVRILATSVRDNVAMFDDSVGDERIVESLEAVGLGGWLADLSDGLDTVLGSGSGLSAGQEQLLSFARVLLRDPGLVVLDEASSRIPPADRLAVADAIRALLKGRTAVIIAHRLDTVAEADEVAVVEDGWIVETGRYQQLSADTDSRLARALTAVEAAV